MALPLLAIKYAYKQHDRQLRREAQKKLKAELREYGREVYQEARASIAGKDQGPSRPGTPFASFTGRTRKSLGMKASKSGQTVFVGFRQQEALASRAQDRTKRKVKISAKTGKVQMRSHANILEHGARHTAARPVLEPALERVRNRRSPFRALVSG